MKWRSLSCVWLFAAPWTIQSMEFSRSEYWNGEPFPSPRDLPTQRSNPGFPHCRQILYHLNHQGSPRILEWAAYSFSSRSSWSRKHTGVSCIAGGFFTSWASREALVMATRHEWRECSGSWSWWQLPWCKLCWNSLKYAFKKCVFGCTWITHQSGWFAEMHSIALWHYNKNKTGHCILDQARRNLT